MMIIPNELIERLAELMKEYESEWIRDEEMAYLMKVIAELCGRYYNKEE